MMIMKTIRTFLCVQTGGIVCLFLAGLYSVAYAEGAYPQRPIRVLVGFPPGSGTDMVARMMGQKLSPILGQTWVVDNRPGANGVIAAQIVARSVADGHTLLALSVSHTMNAAVYPLSFDTVQSFSPLMQVAVAPLLLVANPGLAAKGVAALIEEAQARPQTIRYAISGLGGINHFAGALFSHMAKLQLVDVPYKGGAQALNDLISGQVQIMFATSAIGLTPVRSGRLKVLAVTTLKRSAWLPNIPTINESGVPGYEMSTWWGFVAPHGLNNKTIDFLNQRFDDVLKQPDVLSHWQSEAASPSAIKAQAFEALLHSEVSKWMGIARQAQIKGPTE